MKNCFSFDHLWEARGAREAMEEGLSVSIDFSKGFDSLHHNYFGAFFVYIGLPIPMIALFLSMLTSLYVFGGRQGSGLLSPTAPSVRSTTRGPPVPSTICHGLFRPHTHASTSQPPHTSLSLHLRFIAIHPHPVGTSCTAGHPHLRRPQNVPGVRWPLAKSQKSNLPP